MHSFGRNFFKGLFIVAPMALTLSLVFYFVRFLDGLLHIPIPGVGLLLTVVLITGVGMLASNMVGRTVLRWVETGLSAVPLVNLVYTSLKDLTNAFIGDQRRFRQPVVVDLCPGRDLHVLGFITQQTFEQAGLPEHVAVYVPQSYNIAGNLLIVPRAQVRPIDTDGSQAMAFIVSGGIASLKNPRKSGA